MRTEAAAASDPGRLIADGRATLGIEFGSTRIKACLIDAEFRVIASGSHDWENDLVDGRWTYADDAIWSGMQDAYAALVADVRAQYDITPTAYQAIGVSAMMHGYLALDADGELLVPFRTWRNTSTGPAATALSKALDFAIPLRWSIAHLYQAVLDDEPHLAELAAITTLAGYVHRRLTGRHVLGVGDASGVFPIDPTTRDYDARMLDIAQALVADHAPAIDLRGLLPDVLQAGQEAGVLSATGARLLDPSGSLQPGAPLCPPEGDAGTGMIATNAIAPRTGNVSVGTSIFAMVVLERSLSRPHPELDIVTTPAGDAVAMVHCNNGATELASWAGVFGAFADAAIRATASGSDTARSGAMDADAIYATLLAAALDAEPDAGGLIATNFLSGEPVAGLDDGRPLVLRGPEARLTLGNLIRAQVFGAFAALSLGMEVLGDEQVAVDTLFAHGGVFRTQGAPQRLLAAALDTPIAIADTASEGGAWGIAVLAAYLDAADTPLADFLTDTVFSGSSPTSVEPDAADRAGFLRFLERYRHALPIQQLAVAATPTTAADADQQAHASATNEGADPE
ncbi:xylulokinase [Curtobacterium ammoniigenes]|uniref:xylulokinase n=1 Tax=Curtobacterium ammoniigenes TaxID=395387 RepID=UPI00083006C2|nr:FGGY-family carbohydrate kinase [Curtobacterium ammoniigenes]